MVFLQVVSFCWIFGPLVRLGLLGRDVAGWQESVAEKVTALVALREARRPLAT